MASQVTAAAPLQPVTVSVIMASYNCAFWIEAAVQSVVQQTFENWELIISDDASSDNTIEILQTWLDADKRIRLVQSGSNRGAALARNAALAEAHGRYIAFLDSDDLWKPHKLEHQLGLMQRDGVAFSFSAYERIAEDGTPQGVVAVPPSVNYRQLLTGNVIGCLTAMYDTHQLGKVEMPDIAKRQDYALWLRLLKRVDRAVSIRESLGYYRLRQNSISSNKVNAARFTWRVLRHHEGLPLTAACYYFVRYAIRGIWSHYRPRK